MSEDNERQEKKIGQAEAAKRLLEQRKNAQQGTGQQRHQSAGNQKMKSQQTKKINNQRKRTGI